MSIASSLRVAPPEVLHSKGPAGQEGTQETTNKVEHGRLYFFQKLSEIAFIRPSSTISTLALRVVKLLTYSCAKACLYKICGHHVEAADYLESAYLKTVKTARNLLIIPSQARRAFQDMVASKEDFVDDLEILPRGEYLKVDYVEEFQQFSSDLHGIKTFNVIKPSGIQEFLAASDASLKTVMASHIFEKDVLAINFGCPNVATFVTEEGDKGAIQTKKVDAKSLWRGDMSYHDTNGKIQSGVFLIPKNLPNKALKRFKAAAKKLQKSKDITCVRTNCKVLKDAGFSIEGVSMDGVTFPQTLMEHLLFRNVFYTSEDGVKHKVHFDIMNTTAHNLEEYVEKVDTAVVGTRLRHQKRNNDTEENQRARSEAAKKIIAEEKNLLKQQNPDQIATSSLERRKITVSVPSVIGDTIARIWGRHTIYQLHLADKKELIAKTFKQEMAEIEHAEDVKLRPFPQENPDFSTRLKRDFFFSSPMIKFLRRHMMGHMDELQLQPQKLLRHLKSTNGQRLNYVILDDKVVLAKVHANGKSAAKHRNASDWALSKHALLAARKDVYCSGEMWYDKAMDRFYMNNDSGTYKPSDACVKKAATLANIIFACSHETRFKAVKSDET